MNPSIEISDLTVSYDQKPVLWGVDLVLPQAAIIGIAGPNGSGKSTLIKAIMGLVPHQGGKITILGKPYKSMWKNIAYVPQRESIDWDFPITVREVVMMGRYGKIGLLRFSKSADHQAVDYALERVSMSDFTSRQIGDLSGGQQQRVFLARALAQESDLLIMDEPFAGVDAVTEQALLELMGELKQQGKTLIIVHHDLATLRNNFDYLVFLNKRIVANGPANEIFTPDNLRKTYGGQIQFLEMLPEKSPDDASSS